VAIAAAAVVGDVPPAVPPTATPQSVHDAITAPAKLPFEPLPAPPAPGPLPASTPARHAIALDTEPAPPLVKHDPLPPPPVRTKTPSNAPPIEEIDEGWDLGDDDPTATSDAAQAAAAADNAMERPAPDIPSSSEMAGDAATGGDGIDEPGWD
jgi:hypothetical protein